MPDYRRVKIKGGTYFFTLVTYKRRKIFLSPKARRLFLEALHHERNYHWFYVLAYYILPDHIHLIWEMPKDDANYSMRIGEIKKRFSKQYIAEFGSPTEKSVKQIERSEAGLWQHRFWEHYIRDENDLFHHIDYIHYNPVKHGVVKQTKDWPNSSFFDYVQAGYYDITWGQDPTTGKDPQLFGE